MAFLFKSKKNQDRALASRDGPPSSGGSSIQSAAARVREEKGSRSTPTGSLNSLDNEGSMGSPDQNYSRQRGQSLEQTQQGPPQLQQQQPPSSDLPVSSPSGANCFRMPRFDGGRGCYLTCLCAVSQWRCLPGTAWKSEFFVVSMVATAVDVHLVAS